MNRSPALAAGTHGRRVLRAAVVPSLVDVNPSAAMPIGNYVPWNLVGETNSSGPSFSSLPHIYPPTVNEDDAIIV